MGMLRKHGRRVRLQVRRCLRFGLRHGASMLSAAVLVVALMFSMTSSSFVGGSSRAPQSAARSEVASTPRPFQPREQFTIYYYLVESEARIEETEQRLKEASFRRAHGVTDLTANTYYFVMDTPRNEALAARFINVVTESAPYEGYNLKVIDLRP